MKEALQPKPFGQEDLRVMIISIEIQRKITSPDSYDKKCVETVLKTKPSKLKFYEFRTCFNTLLTLQH